MAKRRVKVKLSKTEMLERDVNKWLGKKDDAIAVLVKAVTELKFLRRRQQALEKSEARREAEKALAPAQRKIARKLNKATSKGATLGESCDAIASGLIQGKTFEQAAIAGMVESREFKEASKQARVKHMESLGFRKIGRKKKVDGKAQSEATG